MNKQYEYIKNRDYGLYIVFMGMKMRCNSKNHRSYHRYGGRGIKIEWKSYREFKADMYENYLDHLDAHGKFNTSLDRVNNDGNYCKENCRWITHKQQHKKHG